MTNEAERQEMETTARALIRESHQDEPWEERVVKHLGVLAGAGTHAATTAPTQHKPVTETQHASVWAGPGNRLRPWRPPSP
jgi:hypothetical protein